MSAIAPMPDGGYAYVPGVFQYSAGVVALPGHAIERVTFMQPVPLEEGFTRIEEHLRRIGRPLTAFCGCELRSPGQFTEEGFRAFNEVYVGTLERWGIFRGGVNPVARSNVCPEVNEPPTPSFYAFAYTIPSERPGTTFQVAGSGEAPEGQGDYRNNTVRLGDLSAEGIAEKARWVLGEMERRLSALGAGWSDVTATQLYTVHDIHHVMAPEIEARGAARHGLIWHYARPPVVNLEYEMDCRCILTEHVV
ncbi:MAG: hypothetical protein AAGF45_00155 [Pseudomonadota bacterium]